MSKIKSNSKLNSLIETVKLISHKEEQIQALSREIESLREQIASVIEPTEHKPLVRKTSKHVVRRAKAKPGTNYSKVLSFINSTGTNFSRKDAIKATGIPGDNIQEYLNRATKEKVIKRVKRGVYTTA